MGIMQGAVANLPLGTGVVSPLISWSVDSASVNSLVSASLAVGTDGSLTWVGGRVQRRGSAQWYNPITLSVGNSYWVRLVPTTTYGAGLFVEPVNVWLPLTSSRIWVAQSENGIVGALFNLQFSTDDSGSVIVGTMTGNRLIASCFVYDNPGGF